MKLMELSVAAAYAAAVRMAEPLKNDDDANPGPDPDVALYINGKRYEINDLIWWAAGRCFVLRRMASDPPDNENFPTEALLQRLLTAAGYYQRCRDGLPNVDVPPGGLTATLAEAHAWAQLRTAIEDLAPAVPPPAFTFTAYSKEGTTDA